MLTTNLTVFQYFAHCHPFIIPALTGLIGLFVRSLFGFGITKGFRRTHPILGIGAGKAIGAVFIFTWKWFTLPLINKIVFLFTPKFYKAQLIHTYKEDIKNHFKNKIEDLEDQVRVLETDRQRLINNRNDENSSDEAYWRGAKYGFSLSEKSRKNTHSASKKLNDSQLFTLTQIAEGNSTINGLVGAYLEDRGYVKLVWDNEAENKYHYEITEKGSKRLEKHRADEAAKKQGRIR